MIDLLNYLDITKKYLVATSGGPDSMALLDMCVQQGFSISAFHMNYHKRATADRDQRIVQDYCKSKGIDCFVCDYQHCGLSNFQADARQARYQKAATLIQQYHFEALLVAHQKDDVIETFIMQENSHRKVNYYGLAVNTRLYSVEVIRPLLSLTKDECQRYCDRHHICYGIDESNLSDDYTRNQIRHSVIAALTDEEKKRYIAHINAKNNALLQQKRLYQLDDTSVEFMACDDLDIMAKALRQLLCHHSEDYGKKSHQYFCDIVKSLVNKRVYQLFDYWYLFYETNRIWIEQILPMEPIQLMNLNYGNYGYFSLMDKGSVRQGVSASEDEFPLTVRRWKEGDSIETKFGMKKVSRWMIDTKMHPRHRLFTNVIVNNCGKVIFLSGFGCDYSHYCHHKKVFMIE